MLTVLLALLALDAVLHIVLVARFGVKGNEPPLLFAVIYVALTLAVRFAVPYALWATLVLAVIGIVGLTVTFRSIPRDKTLDGVIWVVDVLVIVCTAILLFG